MSNTLETLEQEAPVKTIKQPVRTPKPTPAKKVTDLPAPSKNEFKDKIEWLDFDAIKRAKIKEEPLHIIVYYKICKSLNEKKKEIFTKHDRITFSHFLSRKYGENKKYKFGALDGKIMFQVTAKDGLFTKIGSKEYPKNCISNCAIAEIIYEKYGLVESSHSAYFKLKDLGNDFYLIDEILK